MLRLQRASAGSGKTYTLTKIYIRCFIAKKVDGTYRLRTESEMKDVHGRILAITFTNKSTNEMKHRIVKNLADLAGLTGLPDKDIEYLQDFCKEFGASSDEVKGACRNALSILLHRYSDFQISTIDSFFQSILRTLAVETDRNENYQVELDNDYLSQVGVDSTLSEVNLNKGKSNSVKFWIRNLMLNNLRSGEKRWNPFVKQSDLYKALVKFTSLFQTEIFQREVEKKLMDYFNTGVDFLKVYRNILKAADEHHDRFKHEYISRANAIAGILAQANLYPSDITSNLKKLVSFDVNKCKRGKLKLNLGKVIMNLSETDDAAVFTKATLKRINLNCLAGIAQLLCAQREMMIRWDNFDIYWEATIKKLYYLGLIQSIMFNIRKFREENNIIPLSDTNRILKGIINEEDAPFIYERIGTYLQHYLIDEFQDTSKMQWENLKPLIAESLSYEEDHDNLIIGDVKQSIYRFRNAESSLIQHDVPCSFDCDLHGMDMEENSNWRSSKDIVRFNNSFFHHLTQILDNHTGAATPESKRTKMTDIYDNTIQMVRKNSLKGQISISFVSDKDKFSGMGELVTSLLEKGYKQKEIAFLVNTNKQGCELIEYLVEYNDKMLRNDPSFSPMSFISEESLHIAESKGVKLIISVLELIAGNTEATSEDNTYRRKVDIKEFVCNYNYYRISSPELTTSEIVERFFNEDSPSGNITQIMKSIQSSTLPALVETIVEQFVPQEIKDSDAMYIAAFQDKVTEYCGIYTSDVTSFLQWWKEKASDKASISSPEDTDAVQVMTIHKAKGLEFKCVIIPCADWVLGINNSYPRTLWVEPRLPEGIEIPDMPPYIPIEAKDGLKGTLYEKEYTEELDKEISDQLNKTYVAFTRAVNELHIYAPVSNNKTLDEISDTKKASIGNFIAATLKSICNSDLAGMPEEEYMIGRNDIVEVNNEGSIATFRIGSVSPCDVEEMRKKELEKKDKEKYKPLESKLLSYYVNTSITLLKSEDDDPERSKADEYENEIQRRKGKLLHAIMENIITSDDIHKAVEKMRIKGRLTRTQANNTKALLTERLTQELPSQWFAKGIKVLTERTILCRGKSQRPDRIIEDSEGNIIVIDYKFGSKVSDKYDEQVIGYIRHLKSIKNEDGKTSKFRSVKGYLWYVTLDIIKDVTPTSPKASEQS